MRLFKCSQKPKSANYAFIKKKYEKVRLKHERFRSSHAYSAFPRVKIPVLNKLTPTPKRRPKTKKIKIKRIQTQGNKFLENIYPSPHKKETIIMQSENFFQKEIHVQKIKLELVQSENFKNEMQTMIFNPVLKKFDIYARG